MMANALLEADKLSPCCTDLVDRGQATSPLLSLSLQPKTITAVIGDEGKDISGWLSALAGITDPCSGSVSVMGQNLAHLDKAAWQSMRAKIACLDTDTRLMSVLSVLENILLPAHYHKLANHNVLVSEVESMFRQIEFPDMSILQQLPANVDRYAYGFSLIVRALLLKPKIIVMNNFLYPYTKTDADVMLWFVCSKIEQQDMAALVFHHDYQQVLDICTNVLFIGKDALHKFGSRDELLQCNNEEIQIFLNKNDIGEYG